MVFALGVSVIWLALLLLPDQPWRMREALSADPQASAGQRVGVLIPARNEEAVLSQNLRSLARQRVPLEVWVLNDGSTDRTAEVAREASLEDLHVLDVPPLAAGWTGKLWALEQGRTQVSSDWVLLLDADIALAPGMLPTLLAKGDQEGLDLVSIMATPTRCGFWDHWLMPVFIYYFKWLYPFRRANHPRSRVGAAAGGCILIRRRALEAIGGFAALRDAVIDDCTLARRVKEQGFKTWIGVSRSVTMLRDHSFRDIWNMVARTAFTQLHYSYLTLFVAMAGLLLVYGVPPLFFFLGNGAPIRLVALAGWLLMAASFAPTAHFYDESPFWGFLLPLAALFFLLMTLHSALRYAGGVRTRWRGRTYGNPSS